MKALQTNRAGNSQLSGGILAILAGASTCGAVSAVSHDFQLLRDANSMCTSGMCHQDIAGGW